MTTERLLTASAAVPLAHSLVSFVAADAGVRALSIKGAFAAEYGLRESRSSADADVMIEPSEVSRLRRALEVRGWHTRAGRMPPTFIDLHSVTLINDSWPCDLDLHRFFPGFFADADQVFELLWRNRDAHRAGGSVVLTPSRAGMAVIVALHAARTPHLERSRRDLVSVRQALEEKFTEDELKEFCEIVQGGRSQWVLRDLTSGLNLPLGNDDATESEKRTWTRNQQPAAQKSAALWMREVAHAPLHRKIRALTTALWVPRADIPRNDPQRMPSWSEAIRYQYRRWTRGARSLRGYLQRQRSAETYVDLTERVDRLG